MCTYVYTVSYYAVKHMASLYSRSPICTVEQDCHEPRALTTAGAMINTDTG